ncbi:hypothetical protein [uncultured Oscillibacter sp.]|uniref:tetratricopeptide repeat protein n=1 Tax=uncultured Oscillibacter sp. TaxID=876091 RepID=UPI0025E8F45A|nr:hypothetical protein [uncultured Oscillibacter sp.]
MAAVLSSEVERALQDIYYDVRTGRGKEAFALLEEASAAGDGDASCVLARCLCGYQYVWRGHGFPEDDERATKLLHKSVEQGSALGVLVALRSGELTPSVQKKMPFQSLQAAFDEVEALAEGGDAFCQYIVGNSYFWWDFLRIQDKGKDSFSSQAEFKAYLKEQISKCEDWFWKAFRGGVYFAANNLNKYYREGDEDIIAPQPEKAKDLYKTGAELGYPLHQSIYADELKKAERYEEALRWYREAAEGGNPNDWFEVGFLYEEGKGTEQDMAYAVSCYQKELARDPDHTGANNYLGRAYFTGKGVPQDYAKAFRHLSVAHDKKGNTWGVFYLAKCCFYGLGTPQDYAKALRFLDKVDWQNREADYMRGVIFARGLGGAAADIPKGVAYLQKAGSFDKAKEELLHYKKTLFGKWVRRD